MAKKRSTVDLPENLWKRLDKNAIKLSYDRNEKISRNMLIEELLEDGLDQLEEKLREEKQNKRSDGKNER